jgi:hypothetical protein
MRRQKLKDRPHQLDTQCNKTLYAGEYSGSATYKWVAHTPVTPERHTQSNGTQRHLQGGAHQARNLKRSPRRQPARTFPKRPRMASRRAGAETINDTEVDSVVETLHEMSGASGPDASSDAVAMEAHGTGIEYTYDRVKRALGLHTDHGETLREALGQSPVDLFGCSHMLGGFADVGPTKVTH